MNQLNLEAIAGRCEAARYTIGRLCRGNISWTMSIPVHDDDTDIVLMHPLRDIPALVADVKRLRAELEQTRFQLSQLVGAEGAFKKSAARAQRAERERKETMAEVRRLRAMIGEQRYYTAETTEAIAAERDELRASLWLSFSPNEKDR